jgi:hypothetical protein
VGRSWRAVSVGLCSAGRIATDRTSFGNAHDTIGRARRFGRVFSFRRRHALLCTRKDHSGLKNCLGAAESTTAAEATRHYFGPFLMAAASDRLPELVRREFRRTWIANSGCERGRRVTALVVRGLSVDRSVVVNTRSFHDE